MRLDHQHQASSQSPNAASQVPPSRPFAASSIDDSAPPDQEQSTQSQIRHSILNLSLGGTPPLDPRHNLIQAKLSIGQPNDSYEQEADRVATDVVQRVNLLKPAAALQHITRQDSGFVQQKPNLIQRYIEPLEGQSSGMINAVGKAIGLDIGRRDKLNALVTKYNAQEGKHPKPQTNETLQKDIDTLDTILQDAKEWATSIGKEEKSSGEKLEEILDFIKTIEAQKQEKENLKVGSISEILSEHQSLEDAQISPIDKIPKWEKLIFECQKWLSYPEYKKHKRRQTVEKIKLSLEEKFYSDQNLDPEAENKKLKHDGEVSEVYKLHYKTGDKKDSPKGDNKDSSKGFRGYFKAAEGSMSDNAHECTNAKPSGIPKENPRLIERNLAMYELDKLLGAGVIPPTFAAKHAGKAGMIMPGSNSLCVL
jgi:hypothetical protein